MSVIFAENAEGLGLSTKRKCGSSKTEESSSMKLITCREFRSGHFTNMLKEIPNVCRIAVKFVPRMLIILNL
jgi:hypothetical protein